MINTNTEKDGVKISIMHNKIITNQNANLLYIHGIFWWFLSYIDQDPQIRMKKKRTKESKAQRKRECQKKKKKKKNKKKKKSK